MELMEAVIYFLIFLVAYVVGMPIGAWLNSKLLTKTWKGEIDRVRKEIGDTMEYREVVDLVHNLNELLKSEEAKNFFAEATRMLKHMAGTQDDGEPLMKFPARSEDS